MNPQYLQYSQPFWNYSTLYCQPQWYWQRPYCPQCRPFSVPFYPFCHQVQRLTSYCSDKDCNHCHQTRQTKSREPNSKFERRKLVAETFEPIQKDSFVASAKSLLAPEPAKLQDTFIKTKVEEVQPLATPESYVEPLPIFQETQGPGPLIKQTISFDQTPVIDPIVQDNHNQPEIHQLVPQNADVVQLIDALPPPEKRSQIIVPSIQFVAPPIAQQFNDFPLDSLEDFPPDCI